MRLGEGRGVPDLPKLPLIIQRVVIVVIRSESLPERLGARAGALKLFRAELNDHPGGRTPGHDLSHAAQPDTASYRFTIQHFVDLVDELMNLERGREKLTKDLIGQIDALGKRLIAKADERHGRDVLEMIRKLGAIGALAFERGCAEVVSGVDGATEELRAVYEVTPAASTDGVERSLASLRPEPGSRRARHGGKPMRRTRSA